MQTKHELVLPRPDDFHVHFREGAGLADVVRHTALQFGRALVMPNLQSPVTTARKAVDYRNAINAVVPDHLNFSPLMTLYLTEDTDVDDLTAAHASGLIKAVKLYPAGATTNSASGVHNFDKIRPILERMAEIGCPLCVHGEVTDPEVDIFDREAVFIDRVLTPLRRDTPGLRVIMEHITTSDAVEYVKDEADNLAATVTTHHLMINRNHILAGGIKPHYYCLPVAKRETHRVALRKAATSGNAKFFLGTDSAPHVDAAKEQACGCAGCFTATNTMAILAHVFEQEAALEQLEAFTSLNGPAFYGLPVNTGSMILTKGEVVRFPDKIATKDGPITVFDPGVDIQWQVTQ